MTARDEQLLRDYAAKRISWRDLRARGWHYRDVLAGLGELGVDLPVLDGSGPNADALARGLAWLREALDEVKHREDRDATPPKNWETVH